MKLIKTIDSRETREGVKTTSRRWGLFECPVCKQHVEKSLTHGKRNKTCGNKECRKAAFTPAIKPASNGITTAPYYSAFSGTYQRLKHNDYFTLSEELLTFSVFTDIIYSTYVTYKNAYIGESTVYITTNDDSTIITKENIRCMTAQEDYIPIGNIPMYSHLHVAQLTGVWRAITTSTNYTVCDRWKDVSKLNEDVEVPGKGMVLRPVDYSKELGPDNYRWMTRADARSTEAGTSKGVVQLDKQSGEERDR